MGRITRMQNEIGQLQGVLAKKNVVISAINSRDKKIKDAIQDTLKGRDGAKKPSDLIEDIAKII